MRTREFLKECGEEECEPNITLLRQLHASLNEELFDGALLPCELTFGDSSQELGPVYGACYPLGDKRVRIHLDTRCTTISRVVMTMAHEMVHQWQYQVHDHMHHGNSFRQYGARIKRMTGIII